MNDEGIYVSADRWRSLRANPAFLELLRLGRIVNSLSLTNAPFLVSPEDQSPRARRDRFAAFFFMAALLHEGLRTAEGLGRYFRKTAAYRNGFAKLFSDPEVIDLRSGDLAKIRNELVFHFDREPLRAGLKKFPYGETVLATASEFTHLEFYFDAADAALLAYLCRDGEQTEQEYAERVQRLLDRVVLLFGRFLKASNALIAAALVHLGCKNKRVKRPPTSSSLW